MSILRKQTKSGYTHINNELLNAEGLSFRAKGIAVFLLSKPDDWKIRVDYLMRVGKEGEVAIRTALQELAVQGFLMRERIRENNRIRTITRIADYPAFIDVGTPEQRINGYVSDIQVSEDSGISSSENRHLRKRQVLVNTEEVTPEKVRSKRKKKNYSEEPPPPPRKKYSAE